ncbi:hypothetical protein GBAR_LOCUS4959 [Geodia barretti]|uniref:Fibronectin type-III domain-containing protein n=1 Tax=Geodia barretti TaxID=519541 RepID=A0AA35R8Q9_GEOBA|nr:hypothetical protein GBAR_LOCUS4959 [Geodia barretti]
MTRQRHVWYMILLVGLCINRDPCIAIECTPSCQPPASTEEWFSDLMVCDIKPRNATLIWTRDADTTNASYIVLYEVTGNQIRSDLISGDEEQFTHVLTDLTPETVYEVQVCQPALSTCGNCEVEFSTPAAEGITCVVDCCQVLYLHVSNIVYPDTCIVGTTRWCELSTKSS